MVVCGFVLVVSCLVLCCYCCVFVCDLFLFLQLVQPPFNSQAAQQRCAVARSEFVCVRACVCVCVCVCVVVSCVVWCCSCCVFVCVTCF